jgi:glycosyltransferase involved in cell wall biosynthesis
MPEIKSRARLSVILPVYNKQNSIVFVATQIKDVIEKELHLFDYEIIYVDDFSTDGSYNMLRRVVDSHTLIFSHHKNLGQLKAIETGLRSATGEIFAIYSCDMQNSFRTIVPLYNAIEEGYDLAIGYRALRSDTGFGVLMSKVFFGLLSLIEKKMPKGGFDYGLFNKHIYNSLIQKDFNSIFMQLETLYLSRSTYYLPAERINDTFDKSSWPVGRKFRYASQIFRYLFKR